MPTDKPAANVQTGSVDTEHADYVKFKAAWS